MLRFPLDGKWSLQICDGSAPIQAVVPGSVYSALLDGRRMEDPFWRDNEMEALALMKNDFVFSHTFEATDQLLNHSSILLKCEGLDTLATLYLNGALIASTNNMHRTWEFEVKPLLLQGKNHIEIHFKSPTNYIEEAYTQSKANGTDDAMVGFPLLRKAHCMFGWDWGPRLPDAGIWRSTALLGIDTARIKDVRVLQSHQGQAVHLQINTEIDPITHEAPEVCVTVTTPDGAILSAKGERCNLCIADPQIWWPNGFGAQPLYDVQVQLLHKGHTLDVWQNRIGLRTITMHIQKDEWGESFCHRVNGVDIFAMGADYIPEDNILARVTPQRTRRLLEDAVAANFNCIRVWGGGYYPDDYFYDICDELGLIVWQDAMFACAVYNLSEEFDTNIRAEIADNAKRLRHHACLGLWCGNNEMEQFVDVGFWGTTPQQKADYIKMYEYILPQVLKEVSPEVFYWPSSPSSGGSFDAPNDPNRGDVHYWEVWHGGLPFTDYRNHHFRYVSEFGFQSFPCMKTIESFTLPEDRNVFSYVMEKHQRNASANSKIIGYLAQMYPYPREMSTLVYASQLLQAQAMQYGVEHWRRHRGRCMGAIIWQLNDCWPVASWSSIDYYGRWKALHYYAKRFFAPVLISCHEEGVLSQNTNVNAQPFTLKKSAQLNISNETTITFHGTASWSLRAPDASILKQGQFTVEVPALSSVWLPEQDFSQQDTFGCYYFYQLTQGDKTIGEGSVLFCPPKHFRFEDPQLHAVIDGDAIVVTAGAYARSVEICCNEDVVLEDNYFDMNPGCKRIAILRGTPSAVTVQSVYDIR